MQIIFIRNSRSAYNYFDLHIECIDLDFVADSGECRMSSKIYFLHIIIGTPALHAVLGCYLRLHIGRSNRNLNTWDYTEVDNTQEDSSQS